MKNRFNDPDESIYALFRGLMWLAFSLGLLEPIVAIIADSTILINLTITEISALPLDSMIILILLYLKPVRKLLAGKYLPVMIILASVLPVLRLFYQWIIYFHPQGLISFITTSPENLTTMQVEDLELLLSFIPALIIPALVAAWHYRFKIVLWFILLPVALEVISISLISLKINAEVELYISTLVGLFISTTLILVISGIFSYSMGVQRKQQQELKQANQRLLNYVATLEQLTISQERNRMARELHDTVAHTLSGLAVQLEATRALWHKQPQQAEQKLDDSIAATRHGLMETRRALSALRATPLEDLGLALAIKTLAENTTERCQAGLTLVLPDDQLDISPDMAQAFYRIAQESLENIARHACATQITLKLVLENQILTLEIHDNGMGFDGNHPPRAESFGLQGMKERADLIGGECIIISQPQQGVSIIFKAGV